MRLEAASEDVEVEISESQLMKGAEDAAAFHQALDDLPPAHREVVLFFLEEFSIAEIAQATSSAQGTVKSRIHYAKKALRTIISRRIDEQPK